MSDLEGVSHPGEMPGADHRAALLQIIKLLGHGNKLEIKAIGHRIVHGGEDFSGPVLITESVVRRIEELGDLAPLHNPAGALPSRESYTRFHPAGFNFGHALLGTDPGRLFASGSYVRLFQKEMSGRLAEL
jgi:hypothetical protein